MDRIALCVLHRVRTSCPVLGALKSALTKAERENLLLYSQNTGPILRHVVSERVVKLAVGDLCLWDVKLDQGGVPHGHAAPQRQATYRPLLTEPAGTAKAH